MILDRPMQTVTTAVDGDVLEVLARADDWFSVSRIHGAMGLRRSPEGIRAVLARLVGQGVVERSDAAVTPVYRLNRRHLAADSIIALASLHSTLLDRIRTTLNSWDHPPRYAALFGSGARGRMRTDSDIDLFLVSDGYDLWESGVEQLIEDVTAWTGNHPGMTMYDPGTIGGRATADPVLRAIADTGIFLVGDSSAFRKEIEGPRG